MRVLIVALAALLAGCGQQQQLAGAATLTQIHEECRYASKPFVETWNCVRVGTGSIPVDPDIMGVYVATGDFVVEQIRDGKMTDTEAKLAMAQARQRAREDASVRDTLDSKASPPPPANRPSAMDALVLSGIMSQPAPAPSQPLFPPPVYSQPAQRAPLTCQRSGPSSVVCF